VVVLNHTSTGTRKQHLAFGEDAEEGEKKEKERKRVCGGGVCGCV
jgi:hypothetical protein